MHQNIAIILQQFNYGKNSFMALDPGGHVLCDAGHTGRRFHRGHRLLDRRWCVRHRREPEHLRPLLHDSGSKLKMTLAVLKLAIPGLFFINFCLFKQTLQFFTTSSIRC